MDVLWRFSTLDAFYSTFTGPIDPLVPGSANNKRFLGEQFYLHAEWYPTPHLDIVAAWMHFQTAGFLAAAHGKNTDYIGVWTAYEF